MTIVYFLIALSILIVVHELGHFLVARFSGIGVEKFSIGFGPKLWGIKRGGTEYRISILPFGGYVKMVGDESAETKSDDQQAFYNKPVSARARVVAAGPVMNLILCLVLMPLVFMIGKVEPKYWREPAQITAVKKASPAEAVGFAKGDVIVSVEGKKVKDWKGYLNRVLVSQGQELDVTVERDNQFIKRVVSVEPLPERRGGYIGVEPFLFIGNEAVMDAVVEDSPAAKAGVKPGDEVISINGDPISDWIDMAVAINNSGGQEVILGILREGSLTEIRLTPEYNDEVGRFLMGVSQDPAKRDIPTVKRKFGFFASVGEGVKEAYSLVGMTFKVLGKLVTFKLSYKSLGGPIQIAQATAAAARSGLASFIYFLAFLSLQLGILNLLPVPILDGGFLAFFGIEAIRRRPLSEKIQGVAQQIGLAFIIFVLVLVSINDLSYFEGVRSFFSKLF